MVSVVEDDFAAAFRDRKLIGNPQRPLDFFEFVEATKPTKRAHSKSELMLVVTLRTLAVTVGILAIVVMFNPWIPRIVATGGIVVGGILYCFSVRMPRSEPRDPATEIPADPAVTIDALWLIDVPAEILASSTARTRWDAASLAVSLTADDEWGMAVAGNDYDDPTFEDRFAAARLERVLEVFAQEHS